MTDEPHPPTPQNPHRIPDPGYDPGQGSAAERVEDPGYDPGPPPTNHVPQLPPDDLVEQVKERAAEKVAAVTVPGGPPIMNRSEAILAVSVLIILNLAALFVGLRTGNQVSEHQDDFKALCEVFVQYAPPEKTADLAKALAECLR